MHDFVQANWTLLEMFVSESSKWYAEQIAVVSKVHWPRMQNIQCQVIWLAWCPAALLEGVQVYQ